MSRRKRSQDMPPEERLFGLAVVTVLMLVGWFFLAAEEHQPTLRGLRVGGTGCPLVAMDHKFPGYSSNLRNAPAARRADTCGVRAVVRAQAAGAWILSSPCRWSRRPRHRPFRGEGWRAHRRPVQALHRETGRRRAADPRPLRCDARRESNACDRDDGWLLHRRRAGLGSW